MDENAKDFGNVRCDAILVLCAIDSLEKYLNITEVQMKEVWHIERHNLESESPTGDEEEYDQHRQVLYNLDDVYETELYPAMRYSFIVLLHIFTENELRNLCSEIQKERQVTIGVTDLKGSAIEQIRAFLTKLAGISMQEFPQEEWENLRTLQKVRDCIVHAFGRVKDSRDEPFLRDVASKGMGISIGYDGRLLIEKSFSQQQLVNLRNLFTKLFKAVGWYRKAAAQGVELAKQNLQNVENLISAPQKAKYFEDTKTKAEKGDAGSQCSLGEMYSSGEGVVKSARNAAVLVLVY